MWSKAVNIITVTFSCFRESNLQKESVRETAMALVIGDFSFLLVKHHWSWGQQKGRVCQFHFKSCVSHWRHRCWPRWYPGICQAQWSLSPNDRLQRRVDWSDYLPESHEWKVPLCWESLRDCSRQCGCYPEDCGIRLKWGTILGNTRIGQRCSESKDTSFICVQCMRCFKFSIKHGFKFTFEKINA